MKNKTLVIISGISASIGQEILKKYLLEQDTVIYGISRKGVSMDKIEFLPEHHFVVNVNLQSNESINTFISKIPENTYQKINYFHSVGEFKTEINENLEHSIENDADSDGIDDNVFSLVAGAYQQIVSGLDNLSKECNCEFNVVSFGSLADEHDIRCFTSFRKSREIVESFSRKIQLNNPNANMYLFNTSTILSADELIERPYIFTTNVNPIYWITPAELIKRAIGFMELEKGVVKKDIYLSNPNFSTDYFDNDITYKRRVKELYNKNV
jgi:NADP-dependent 3-hydroxy acid dehydrogenase YdfG